MLLFLQNPLFYKINIKIIKIKIYIEFFIFLKKKNTYISLNTPNPHHFKRSSFCAIANTIAIKTECIDDLNTFSQILLTFKTYINKRKILYKVNFINKYYLKIKKKPFLKF